ncbi:hypothetical protein JCM11251_003401 [Rhodosporidiobolus azoricus]
MGEVFAAPEKNCYDSSDTSFVKRVEYGPAGDRRNVVVKCGNSVKLEEAEVLRMCGALSLPVPQVVAVDVFEDLPVTYLSLIEGSPLNRVWAGLNTVQKESLQCDLRETFSRMSAIQAPPGFYGAFSDPFYSALALPDSLHEVSVDFPRPSTTQEFGFWADRLESTSLADFSPVRSRSRRPRVPFPPLRLTHGDVAARNILVDPCTGRLTGLIDWERAG